MGMEQAWLLPAIPAALFVVVALFGRVIPRQGDWLIILGMVAALVVGVAVILDFQQFFEGGVFVPGGENQYGFEWAAIADVLAIDFSTHVDSITVVMITVVTIVALMVMVYSVGYMRGEARYGWYFALLSFFTAAMLLLVVSGNLLQLYLAWEGVGLASYLLIGFYWERQSAAEAAKKAFITTRVGDVGLLIGIILLWRASGTFGHPGDHRARRSPAASTRPISPSRCSSSSPGPAGKSAQFPLHVWLPDAMEGPTPVSALIHAATMVVAGVYLVARMLPVFDTVLVARDVVLYVGLVTALMAATMGLVASDIKRVLAYSTVSQLGFMFVALGAGSVTAAMFHLFTHAFFKSLLFLGSGSVIHATGRQEVEYLGGLFRKMRLTGATFLVGGLALAGIVPLAGFWSKDEILYESLAHGSTAVYVTLVATAALTALYTTRLVVLTFFGQPRDTDAYGHAHESPRIMTAPLVVLAVLAGISGFVAFDGVGEVLGFAGGIGHLVFIDTGHAFEFHPDIAATATVSALLAIAVGLIYWWASAERAERARAWAPEIHRLLVNRYYLDELYQGAIDRVVLGAGSVVSWFDDRVVNRTGVDGGAQGIGYAGLRLKFLQTGRIPNYAFAMAVGIITLALVAFGTS